MKTEKKFRVRVNGEKHPLTADPEEPLLWVLRDQLKLTGTKFGCGEGECGACAVQINGEVYHSCLVTVGEIDPADEIVTIEGLGQPGRLSDLQQAFVDHTAFGCGYCTPGMIVTADAFLRSPPQPSRSEIVKAMDDNLCRCASYPSIVDAIETVAGGDARKIQG